MSMSVHPDLSIALKELGSTVKQCLALRFDPGQLNAVQKHRLLEKLNLGMAIGHGGCHIWSRAVSGRGYPQMKLGKEIDSILTPGTSYPYYAHHIAYSLANNIKLYSPELEISHLCNIKYCINPNHLSRNPSD